MQRIGPIVACLVMAAPAAGAERLSCTVLQSCDPGTACVAPEVPLSLTLKVTDEGLGLSASNGYAFTLSALPRSTASARSYAGTGDDDRTAILLTLAEDGAFELASLGLDEVRPPPGILTGLCTEEQT